MGSAGGRPPRRDRSSLRIEGRPFPRRLVSAASCLLTQYPIHFGTAGRARALCGTPTVGQFDLVAIELPLLPTLNAVALVRSHVASSLCCAPPRGRIEATAGGAGERGCSVPGAGPRGRRGTAGRPGPQTRSESGGAAALRGGRGAVAGGPGEPAAPASATRGGEGAGTGAPLVVNDGARGRRSWGRASDQEGAAWQRAP
jgi:hypothetical protein